MLLLSAADQVEVYMQQANILQTIILFCIFTLYSYHDYFCAWRETWDRSQKFIFLQGGRGGERRGVGEELMGQFTSTIVVQV